MFSEDLAEPQINNDGDGLINEDPINCPSGTNLGTPLPTDGAGSFVVKAVTNEKGVLTTYNPGSYFAMSTVEVLSDIDNLSMLESYGGCTEAPKMLSVLSPVTGGSSVVIVVVGADGVARRIADATSPNVTVTDANNNGVPDDAHAENLGSFSTGDKVLMYVKFGPGLKGKTVPSDNTCTNENQAQEEFDAIDGPGGNDKIYGGNGNDRLNGNYGNDMLDGGNENDTLNGNNGNDALDGGANTDKCTGGPGSDTATNCETVKSVP